MEQKKSPPSSVEAPFERGRERPCPSSAGAGGSFVTVWRQVLERGGALRPSSGCLRASPDGQYLACSTGGTSLCVLDAVGVTDPARRLPFSGHGSAVVSVLLPHHHPSSSSASSSQWRLSDAQGSAPETDASSACSVSTGSGGHEAATAEIFRMLRGASAVPENRRFRCFSWSPPLLSRYGPRLVKQNLDLCACLLCTTTRDGNVALWGVPSRRMPLQQRLSLLCDLSQRWHASLDHQPADPSAGQAHSRRGDPGPSAERSRLIVNGTGIESQPLCYWWTYGEEEHRPLHTATLERCDPDDRFGKKTEADSPSGISDAQACRREPGNVPSRAADFPQGNSFSRRAGSRHEGDPPLAPRIPVFKEGGVLDLAACAKDPRIRSWHDPLVTFSPGAVLLPIIRCEYGRKTGYVERSQADGILQEGEKASETAPRSDTGLTRRESVGVREGGGEQAGSSCKSSRHETELSRFCAQPGSERCGENASLGGSGVQRPGVCFFARKDGDLQVEVDSARGCLCAVAGPHAISIFWLSNRQTVLRFCATRETPPRENEETIDTWVSLKRRGGLTEASEMQTATAAEGGSSSADGISVAETGPTAADLIEKCQREAANTRGGKRRKISARNGIECLSKTAGPWRTAAKPRVADGEEAQEGHEARDDRTDAGMATHETGNAGGAPREGDSREDTKEHRGRRGETGASLESDDEREATEAEDADRLRTASTRAVGSASDARGGRPMRACRSRAPFRVIDSSDDESSDGREAAEARGDTHAKRKSEKRRKESEGGKIAKGKELNKASNEGCEVRGPGRKRKRKAVSSDDDIYDGESTPESSSDEDDFDEESTDESEVAEEDSEDEDRGRYGKKKTRGGAKGKKTSTHKGAKAEGQSKGSTDSRNAPQSRCARPEPHQPRTWRQLTLPAQHAEAQRLLSAAAEAQRPHDGTPKKGESEDRDAREPYVLLVQVLLMPGMSESSEDSPQQGWEPNWRRQTISDIALTPLTVEATSLLDPQGDGRRSEECDLDCEAQDESVEARETSGLNAREVSRRGRQDKLCVRGGAPVVASFASLVPLNHVPPDVWDASSPCLPALQCCGASPFSSVEKDMWLPQATVYAVDSFGVTVSYVLGSLTRGRHASPSGLHRGQSLDLCWTLVRLSQSACSIETDQEGSLLRPLACGARPRITRHDNLDMLDGQSAHEDRCGARVYGPEFRAEPGTTGATEHSASVATVYAEAAREAGLFVKEAYSLEGTSRGQTHVRDSELRGPRDERGSKFEESSRDSSEKNSSIFPGGKQLLEDDQKNLGVLLSEMRGRSAHQLQVMQQLGKLRPRSMQGQDQQRQRRGGTACGRSSVLSLAVSSSGALLFSLTLHQQAYLHIAVAPLAASATELLLLGWQRQCQETSAALFGLLSQVSLKRAGLPTHPAKTICGPCEALDIIPEGKQKRASSLPETCKEIGDGATLSCWRNQEPFARATRHGSVRMSCGPTLAPALPRAALEAVDSVPLWELAFSLCGPKQPVWSSRPASASEAGGATGRKRRRGHLQSSGMSSRFAWEDAELDEGILSADCLQEPESCAGFSGDEETVEQPVCCSSISLSSEGGEWPAGNWGVETNGKSGREARGAVSSLLTQEREERKGEWDDLLKRFLGQGNTGLCMRGDGAVSWGASVKPRDFPSAAADLLRVAFLQAISQRSLGGTVSAASNCGAPESVNALMDCHSSSDQQQSAGVALDMGGCPLTRCDSDACAVRPSAFMGDSEDASKFCVQPREVDLRGRVLLGALLLAVDSITSRFSFQRRLTAAIRSAGLAAVAMSRSAGSKGACSLVCLLRHLKRNVDGLQRRDCGSSRGAAAPDTSVEFPGSDKASHGGQDRDRPPRCYSGTATAVVDVVGSEAKHFVEQHCGENCYLSKWAGLLWHWERVTSLASSCFLTVPPVCSGGESIGNIIRCEGFTSAGDALIASGAQHVVELHMQVVDRLCLLQRLIAIISLCRPPLPVGSMSSRSTEYDAPMRRGPYSNSTSPPLTEPSQARSSLSGTVMQNALVPYHANSASPMNTEACGTAARETEEIAGCSKPAPDVPGALRDTLLEILKNLWGLSKCSKAEIDSRVLQEGDPLSGSQMAAKWLCQGLYAGAFRILPHFPDLFQVQRLCDKASVGGFSGRGNLGREKPFRAEEREETCVNGSPEISAGVDVTHASSELDTTVGDTKVSEGPGSVTAIYSCLICGTEAQLVFFKRDAANSRRREFSMQGPGQPEQNTEQHESCVGAGDHLATSFWRCPAKDDVDDCMQGMLPVEREWGHQNMWLQIGSAISGGGAGFSCPLCRGDLRRSD
uniref:Uncharacterized protein n=1 Tax=Toxoplasma gondii (strain ATCC 50861 / VEG) TaxID=432359 RepID=A0A0F7UWA4_TOXGV|nr:TPA: hypothetical protein BN1205_087400 [Toxoplasma gondii VEG]